MKFEEALQAMREGKKVRVKGETYYLSIISKIYYDGDPDRPCENLNTEYHIMDEDWEIVE
jgi:hypothetical protein